MLAGLPGTPNESSEHKERLAALLPITAASVLENARLLAPVQTECAHSSSAVQAFRAGSSIGTAGDLSAVLVAHAGSVPCEADTRREASRSVSLFFPKS